MKKHEEKVIVDNDIEHITIRRINNIPEQYAIVKIIKTTNADMRILLKKEEIAKIYNLIK